MRTMTVGRVLADAVSSSRHRSLSRDELQACSSSLIERALIHRVPGPLLQTFRHHGIEGDGPLREKAIDDAIVRMTTLHDLEWMSGILSANGIDFLVFKGQVLTTLAGRDRWERPTLDLDVLVRGDDLESAIEVLAAAGARHLDRNWEMMLDMVIGELHLILPMGTSLDLHWNLLVNESMRTLAAPDHRAIFTTSRPVDLDGFVVPTFGPAETLVYSCVHACISGGHRLVWLKDIEQLVLAEPPDWNDVIATACAWGASIQVGAMLARTEHQLGLDVPAWVVAALVPNGAVRRALGALDRHRSVADAEADESILRLATRSLGPDAKTTAQRFASRSLAFARRRLFKREVMSPVELFEDRPGDDARRRYFESVVAASR